MCSLPGVIVHMGIYPKSCLRSLLTLPVLVIGLSAVSPTHCLLSSFLDQILPPEWKRVDDVEWKLDLVSQHPNGDWLMLYLAIPARELQNVVKL